MIFTVTVKRIIRYALYLVSAIIILALGLIFTVEGVSRYTENEVKGLVEECRNLKGIDEIKEVLGEVSQTIEGEHRLEYWLGTDGVLGADWKKFAAGDKLYLFTHRGPPFRYIYVLIGSGDDRVKDVGWHHM